jgi:hypothetical protein
LLFDDQDHRRRALQGAHGFRQVEARRNHGSSEMSGAMSRYGFDPDQPGARRLRRQVASLLANDEPTEIVVLQPVELPDGRWSGTGERVTVSWILARRLIDTGRARFPAANPFQR